MSEPVTHWKATVAYDGTEFAGWQVQDNQRTVQGEIEAALSRIANQPIRVQGAGRTDSGVHAFGQVCSFAWPGEPEARLRHAASKMLSPAIRVVELERVDAEFSARFSAKDKCYRYAIDAAPEPHPLAARFAWHVPFKLDLDRVRPLLEVLRGKHDFAGFESTGSQMESTVRTLFDVRLIEGEGIVTPEGYGGLNSFEFHGDGFLYKMVRNLTGTLIEIARGRFEPEFIAEALESGGPFGGHCAPPHGLALMRVNYDSASAPVTRSTT